MNENRTPDRKEKKNEAWSWVIIIAALFIQPLVGVFLLVAMLTGRDLPGKLISALSRRLNSSSDSTEAKKYYASTSSSQSRARKTAGPEDVQWSKISEQEQQKKDAATESHEKAASRKKQSADDGIAHISKGKNALFYCGWIVLALGVFGGISRITDGAGFWAICRAVSAVLGGLGMLFTAHNKDRKEQLYQNCVRIVGNQAYYDLKALSNATGMKPKKLERELNEMLERHYFPENAFIDKGRGLLVLNREEAEQFSKTVQTAETAEKREQDKYDLLLQELERACGRIIDREMLEKSVQIRGLTAAIFHAVRQEPEKESQISSFLNYYFPTTLKLLDSYADIAEKGYQGEQLAQTRERIKTTADKIISAYQKQLDNLYLHDALDVDSDIDVLETMLKRDGLSESDFKPKGTPGTGN